MIPVEGTAPQSGQRPGQGVILAAVDQSPVAGLVTEAAARLAVADGQSVYVVHAQEGVTAGDVGIEAEDVDAAREVVSAHLDRLAAHHVPATGQVLLHAADHGGAGGSSPSTRPASGPPPSWWVRRPTAACPR